MSQKHLVCQGATCQCQFGNAPDKLKVLTQTKAFINEEEPQEKLVATTADVGATFEKNTFGLCQMQPLPGGGYKPCQAMVTQWSGAYENVTYEENNGHPLLEDSKATCPIGGKDCISIINHGQVSEITKVNIINANPAKITMINPFVNFHKLRKEMLTKPNIIEVYFTNLEGNKIDLGEDEQEIYLVIEGENLVGEQIDIDLTDKKLYFEYNGSILENDLLKNYTFKNDNKEQIKLKVIDTKLIQIWEV